MLTADQIYSGHYLREISETCSSAIISKTENIFGNFYCIFAFYENFLHFEKKDQVHGLNVLEVIDSE